MVGKNWEAIFAKIYGLRGRVRAKSYRLRGLTCVRSVTIVTIVYRKNKFYQKQYNGVYKQLTLSYATL